MSARFAIADRFKTVEEVTSELQKAGLESSELILAVDWTKSNQWQGKTSFGGTLLDSECNHTSETRSSTSQIETQLLLGLIIA